MSSEPRNWHQRLAQGIEPLTLGLALVGSLLFGLALAVSLGTAVGLVGVGAAIFGFGLVYCVGVLVQETKRSNLRDAAFLFRGSVVDAHPTEHFFVRQRLEPGAGDELSPFVRRSIMNRVLAGVGNERFVIVKGQRGSGLSRLVYEAVCKFRSRMVLVTRRMGVASEDPLAMLMRDADGFAAEEPLVLVIRDFAARVIAGAITAEFLSDWLARHPHISIVVTLGPGELERVKAAGEGAEAELEAFEGIAAVLRLATRLKGRELVEARRKYPELERRQLEWLPRHLISASPARERFAEGEVHHDLGRGIVRAVVDWQRAGATRPAPPYFVSEMAYRYVELPADGYFDDELAWALEPIEGSAGLIREVRVEGALVGYEPDPAIVDLLDDRETGTQAFPVPKFAWAGIQLAVLDGREEGGEDRQLAEELLSIGIAALGRGHSEIAMWAFKQAARYGTDEQHQRIVQFLAADTRGSAPQSLVNSRRGDGVIQRLRSISDLASARGAGRRRPRKGKSGMPTPFFAWVYRRRVARTLLRLGSLCLGDVASAAVGLATGLILRGLISTDLDWGEVFGTLGHSLPLWSATAVFACALARLYRQDTPRARLGAIVLAMAVLTGIGFVASVADGFALPVALLAALGGGFAAALMDYRLRVLYDRVSRAWVRDHGLEARTLVIGSSEQATRIEAALPDLSRPTVIVGYLTLGAPDAEARCLGSVEDLARVALSEELGRVIVADPGISPALRQEIANRCHLLGLLADAVPSLDDIRAGSAGFTSGQALVLIPLLPLWQSDPGFYVKRAMDIGISLGALVLLSPLLALLALGAKVTSGKVLTRSWRPGLGGSVFGLYRFNTTARGSGSPGDPSDPDNDPARDTTAFGEFLRNRGLDELPQLVNVLIGQMSLVGPRPLRIADHSKLDEADLTRYVVRPGVTSPWQVCNRPALTHSELVSLDMAYLRNWSILVDLEILVKTARLMIRGREHLPRLVDDDDLGARATESPERFGSKEIKPRSRRSRFWRRRRDSDER